MDANIERLKARLHERGVRLNPHLKTAKSVDVATRAMESLGGPCTVSTLREAEEFAAAGVRDILYAVGIAPQKLERVARLRSGGVDLKIILDSREQAAAVASFSRSASHRLPVLIELDTDGHRAGVRPEDDLLLDIGRAIHDNGAELRGVLTHAGDSYNCGSEEALIAIAEQERAGALIAARRLRDAGLPCPIVSIGSTPTAHYVQDLAGITEVRAGVFVFFDLLMANLGVCSLDDIAISVLSTVIGRQARTGHLLIDAGWMAMSQDRSTASQDTDYGHGLVCDEDGRPYEDLVIVQANQEHGVVGLRPGSSARIPPLDVGTRVRVLPNHACATAAQHARYHVIQPGRADLAVWDRFGGW